VPDEIHQRHKSVRLLAAEMPEEVQLTASEMLVLAEMHFRHMEVSMVAFEALVLFKCS